MGCSIFFMSLRSKPLDSLATVGNLGLLLEPAQRASRPRGAFEF
jgi:hypothetical protein